MISAEGRQDNQPHDTEYGNRLCYTDTLASYLANPPANPGMTYWQKLNTTLYCSLINCNLTMMFSMYFIEAGE